MKLFSTSLQALPVSRIDHVDDCLSILIVVFPELSQPVLPCQVKHFEPYVLILDLFNIHSDCCNCLNYFSQLELVQDRRFSCVGLTNHANLEHFSDLAGFRVGSCADEKRPD